MKIGDLTGPGLSTRFGVGAADLGAMVEGPDGEIIAVFGDTYREARAGSADWRSPVILIGERDDDGHVIWTRAGGTDPEYARQLWPYIHDAPPWNRGGFSTVIPSDILRVGDELYLHVIVVRGFPRVHWTEIWRSSDGGVTWGHMGPQATFAADLHDGLAQSWTWDFDPDSGWVYVISTAFQSGSGMILRAVRPADIGNRDAYLTWGHRNGTWAWGNAPTVITPPDEIWRETTLRRVPGAQRPGWVLGGFCISDHALSYRVLDGPTDGLRGRVKTPAIAEITDWPSEDHPAGRVAQAYGGYIMPGSELDVPSGIDLAVSQWNTTTHWPYRVMQFATTLNSPSAAPSNRHVLAQRIDDWRNALTSFRDENDISDEIADAERALDSLRRVLPGQPTTSRTD
ncbi:DUF4185 domain-containing protein [Gordonia sp. CPCC 206044]